jgi:excisionase family DNA binding protein
MTLSEIARRIGVSRATAKRLVRTGEIPGGRILYTDIAGVERWRVLRAPAEKWIAERETVEAAP